MRCGKSWERSLLFPRRQEELHPRLHRGWGRQRAKEQPKRERATRLAARRATAALLWAAPGAMAPTMRGLASCLPTSNDIPSAEQGRPESGPAGGWKAGGAAGPRVLPEARGARLSTAARGLLSRGWPSLFDRLIAERGLADPGVTPVTTKVELEEIRLKERRRKKKKKKKLEGELAGGWRQRAQGDARSSVPGPPPTPSSRTNAPGISLQTPARPRPSDGSRGRKGRPLRQPPRTPSRDPGENFPL